MVLVGSTGLRWWCLVVLSCGDVGGGARSVWLAVGVISCRDYELKRERESQGKREYEGREKILK